MNKPCKECNGGGLLYPNNQDIYYTPDNIVKLCLSCSGSGVEGHPPILNYCPKCGADLPAWESELAFNILHDCSLPERKED